MTPGRLVDGVARNARHLGHHQGTGDPGEGDLSIFVSHIEPVGRNLAVLSVHHLPVGICDFELDACKRRLLVRTGQFIDDQTTLGLVAELQLDRLAGSDHRRLGRVIQQVARLRPGLPNHQGRARVDPLHQEATRAVGDELAVGVTHYGAGTVGDNELHVGERCLVCPGGHLGHQQAALGRVTKIELDHILLFTADIHTLRCGVDYVAVIACQFLTNVVAGLQAGDREGPVPRCHIGPDDRAPAAGGVPAQITELKTAVGDCFPRLGIVFPDHKGTQGSVLKNKGMALPSGHKCLLGVRILDGIAGGWLQFLDPEPAVFESLTRASQLDAAVFIRHKDAQIIEFARRGLIAGVPDLKAHIGEPLMGDAVFFDNFNDRCFVVLKIDVAVPVWMERDQLAGRIQQVRLRHTFLRNFIDDRQQIFHRGRPIRACFDLGDRGAVGRLHDEHTVFHWASIVGVILVDGQGGAFVVGQDNGACPAGEQLHMMLGGVDEVIRHR